MIDERLIRTTEADMNRLDAARRLAFVDRRSSSSKSEEWSRACEQFRTYSSPLWELWSLEAQRSIVEGGGYWRQTALLYLALSPRFFRSGYLRDVVCHRLKQASLQTEERKSVRDSLLRSLIRRPSTGGFVYDCRLAIKVADPLFIATLEALAAREDPWVRGRARRMLREIQHHPAVERTMNRGGFNIKVKAILIAPGFQEAEISLCQKSKNSSTPTTS